MSAVLRFQFALAILISALMIPLTSSAQERESISDGTITVVQPRGFLRRHRVEVVPRVSWLMGDPYVNQLGVGGSLNYSPSKRIFFGGTFEWYEFNSAIPPQTRRFDEVIETTLRVPETVVLEWGAMGEVSWVPAIGKFTLFNKGIVWFDMYLTLGGGVVNDFDGISPAGVVALGTHAYFNDWFGMSLEFRNRISVQEVQSKNILWNAASVGLAFHFFIPFNSPHARSEGGAE